MRILGIDPGTHVVGYGLVDVEGSRLRFVAAGVLKAKRKDALERRLAQLSAGLREIVDRHRPQAAAVEEVFVKVNPRSALSVGHARGALLSVLGEAGLPVTGHAPASVKRSVAGNGKAAKEQVARMVGAILGLGRRFETDATDALAVAIAHALGIKPRALVDGLQAAPPPSPSA